MLKKVEIHPSTSGFEEAEYYKSLAQLAERRARDIRRIAALEREQLEKRTLVEIEAPSKYADAAERERLKRTCARLRNDLDRTRAELKELKKIHKKLANSRAHRLAEAYVRLAEGDSFFAWVLRCIRAITHLLLRIRRMMMPK